MPVTETEENPVKIVSITGDHILTHEEIETAKSDFMIADQKIVNLEAEKQSFNANIKASIKQHEEKKERLRLTIMQGYEERLIDCYEERNYDVGVISYIEVETGAEIQTRKMSSKDRQTALFNEEESADEDGESTDDQTHNMD